MSFVDNFSDMFGDTISIQLGYVDNHGDFITSGDLIADIPCRLSTKARLVRDISGQETVSSVRAILNNYYNLDVDSCRFFLPDTYEPHENIRTISIKKVSDENGPSYEVVILP